MKHISCTRDTKHMLVPLTPHTSELAMLLQACSSLWGWCCDISSSGDLNIRLISVPQFPHLWKRGNISPIKGYEGTNVKGENVLSCNNTANPEMLRQNPCCACPAVWTLEGLSTNDGSLMKPASHPCSWGFALAATMRRSAASPVIHEL